MMKHAYTHSHTLAYVCPQTTYMYRAPAKLNWLLVHEGGKPSERARALEIPLRYGIHVGKLVAHGREFESGSGTD